MTGREKTTESTSNAKTKIIMCWEGAFRRHLVQSYDQIHVPLEVHKRNGDRVFDVLPKRVARAGRPRAVQESRTREKRFQTAFASAKLEMHTLTLQSITRKHTMLQSIILEQKTRDLIGIDPRHGFFTYSSMNTSVHEPCYTSTNSCTSCLFFLKLFSLSRSP